MEKAEKFRGNSGKVAQLGSENLFGKRAIKERFTGCHNRTVETEAAIQ